MAEPKTKAELFKLLEKSRLLAPNDLQRITQEAMAWSDDPADLCQWLIDRELITRYHAGRLLEGESNGYLVGSEESSWVSRMFRLLEPFSPENNCDCFLARQIIENKLVTLKIVGRKESRKPPLADNDCQFAGQSFAVLGQHPNLQKVFDHDSNEEDEWLVLEYFDGINVDELCFRLGEIPWELAANYVCQIAEALEFGNRNGACDWRIHGGRVLVNGEGRALLVATGHPFVRSRQAAPKPISYADCMAPEVVEQWNHIDIRSDIYSLGCVLYQMLAGKSPFASRTIKQTMHRQVHEPTPSILEFRPDVPDDVASILKWMMAKKPADRIPTPAEVWHSLQPFARPTIERMYVLETPRIVEPPTISLWKLLRMAIWGAS